MGYVFAPGARRLLECGRILCGRAQLDRFLPSVFFTEELRRRHIAIVLTYDQERHRKCGKNARHPTFVGGVARTFHRNQENENDSPRANGSVHVEWRRARRNAENVSSFPLHTLPCVARVVPGLGARSFVRRFSSSVTLLPSPLRLAPRT